MKARKLDNKKRTVTLTLVTSLVLFTILVLVRKTGVHMDEWESMTDLMRGKPFAQPANCGKPIFCYVINWLIFSVAKDVGFPFPVLAVYLVFAWTAISALVFFASKLSRTSAEFLLLFIPLATCPLFIFNETSAMMESAFLPIITVFTANSILWRKHPDNRTYGVWAWVTSFLLQMSKVTTAPLLLTFCFFFLLTAEAGLKRKMSLLAKYVISAVVTATFLNYALVSGMTADRQRISEYHPFLGLPTTFTHDVFDLKYLLPHIDWIRLLVVVYFFYAIPFLIGLGFAWYRARPRWKRVLQDREKVYLLGMSITSLPVTIVFAIITFWPLARYLYPIFWASTLTLMYFLVRVTPPKRYVFAILIILCIIPSLSLFIGDDYRATWWPYNIRQEYLESENTSQHGKRFGFRPDAWAQHLLPLRPYSPK